MAQSGAGVILLPGTTLLHINRAKETLLTAGKVIVCDTLHAVTVGMSTTTTFCHVLNISKSFLSKRDLFFEHSNLRKEFLLYVQSTLS